MAHKVTFGTNDVQLPEFNFKGIFLGVVFILGIIVLVSSKSNRFVNTNNEKRNLQIHLETKVCI